MVDLASAVDGSLSDVPGAAAVLIDDVTHDSRQAGDGTLFVAVRGETHDGHHFASSAAQLGSPAVCVEENVDVDVIQLIVPDTRAALGHLAASVYGHPSRELNVIGVTGTNGKTTVTHYVESMAKSLGSRTGLIGTIDTRIGDERVGSTFTTPEASDFQRLLGRMRDDGVEIVAVEVSSHALELSRVAATEFGVAAFTNLSQDHLDFHGDMDDYGAAKKRLFDEYPVGHAIFNVDDAVGAAFAEAYDGAKTTVGAAGDVTITDVRASGPGTTFVLASPWGTAEVAAPVFGRFNVDNAALAATCLVVSGYAFDDVVASLSQVEGVPGRFELISADDPIRVVVDYAHTPAGISEAIEASRALGPTRVLALIGAGGDRDQSKRPLMGAAVSAADMAVITSDNPRSEDPRDIVNDVVAGTDLRDSIVVEVDRAKAIDRTIDLAEDGDVVLILGRGHEPHQEIAGEMVPFDDRDVARRALAAKRGSANYGADSGSMGT